MTLRNRIKFYQQMAALARSGVPVRGSLQRLAERIPSPEVRTLSGEIEQGQQLGDAFTVAGFSPFECHLVAAGERSAQLDSVYGLLAEFWKRELQFGQALVRQLYYPAGVAHLAIIVGGLFLLPQGTAAMVGAIVLNLVKLYAAALVVFLVVRFSWGSPVAQQFWQAVPLIGGALKSAYAYRWITALRMEFSAGVPFPDAVADAWRASGYLDAEEHAEEGEREMRSGIDLSALVKRWRQLPRDWIDFVETGEISGEFETMFRNMETEAAHTWTMRQERMAEWVPKILVIGFVFVLALEIIPMANRAINAPIEQAEKSIDDASR
jgi:type II secretory pathway component PulF